ncbi:P-loop containing nucleoside triphosphate hydrolase protein [Pisolithus sp. B1]|nr:P-loop containing nucleoside triphosphate hydrolase protein [Pisolithus sp. B1]
MIVSSCTVMGKTGSGMSNLINNLTGMPPEDGADQMFSCTKGVCAYESHRNGWRFIFVDTPGLNNGELSQSMVFGAIARWLEETYRHSIKLTGVIYTQDITDDSWSPTDMQGFQLFHRLCGDEAADRVRLVTTMWDVADKSEADEVEGTLKERLWQSLIQTGAQPQRFNNTPESAWNIVEGLGKTTKMLLLQEELVDMGKAMGDTTAGKSVWREESVTKRNWLERYKLRLERALGRTNRLLSVAG